mgnify:CR=1 FL=1
MLEYTPLPRPNPGLQNFEYQEEWGKGFHFLNTSSFTHRIVGCGVDAVGLLGVRLASRKGRHGNPSSNSYGRSVFPTDSDGRAVSDLFQAWV